MIKEIYFFLRYGPGVKKRQKELGLVEFMKALSGDVTQVEIPKPVQ